MKREFSIITGELEIFTFGLETYLEGFFFVLFRIINPYFLSGFNKTG